MNPVVLQSLELMWKGMVSIFVVIAAIFAATLLISRVRGKKRDTDGQG
jgi:asparagine N-glycosylation enzyme membrane subunit Stt3